MLANDLEGLFGEANAVVRLQAPAGLPEGHLRAQAAKDFRQAPPHGTVTRTQVLVVGIILPTAVLTANADAAGAEIAQGGDQRTAHVALVTHRLLAVLAFGRPRLSVRGFAPGLQQFPANLEHAVAHQNLRRREIVECLR